jgi:hypothetical protein
MKKAILLFLIIAVIVSCATYNASIQDVSEMEQKINLSIYKVSFDSNDPQIEKITINISNETDSTITFIPEKCFFSDDKGFHFLKIPPINLRASENINLRVESLDYYITETSIGGYGYGYFYYGSGTSEVKMQDLNVTYIEINLGYKYQDKEYTGIFRIDVNKVEKETSE